MTVDATDVLIPAGIRALQDRLGHPFADPSLLELAVTHRSYCAEHAGHTSNERLEFLGDAVLGMAVTDHIFATYPDMPEGELAKLRASVINGATLADVAEEIDLGAALRLGKGAASGGGRENASILEDAMEAVFGAIYLDGGVEAAREVILGLLHDRIGVAAHGPGGHDFKTQLQELAARHYDELPVYELADEGPDHEKRFFATVHLGGEARGSGEGRSKKQAEQAAARSAWERLARQVGEPGSTPAAAAAVPTVVDATSVVAESESPDA